MTISAILKEMKNLPAEKLEEVYEFIHSLNPGTKANIARKKKIMSFAGAFADMNDKDYKDLVKHLKDTRSELFDRK